MPFGYLLIPTTVALFSVTQADVSTAGSCLSLMFLLQPFHWPCSGKPIWSQKLHEYFGTISKDLGKKAVENKIPLVTLAMADTYD